MARNLQCLTMFTVAILFLLLVHVAGAPDSYATTADFDDIASSISTESIALQSSAMTEASHTSTIAPTTAEMQLDNEEETLEYDSLSSFTQSMSMIPLSSDTSKIKCIVRHPKNGQVKEVQWLKNFFRFTCNNGFKIFGRRISRCVNGVLTSPPPVCTALGCFPILPNKNLNMIEPRGFSGRVIEFFCLHGYTLRGPNRIHCNGQRWSRGQPQCIEDIVSTTSSIPSKHTGDIRHPSVFSITPPQPPRESPTIFSCTTAHSVQSSAVDIASSRSTSALDSYATTADFDDIASSISTENKALQSSAVTEASHTSAKAPTTAEMQLDNEKETLEDSDVVKTSSCKTKTETKTPTIETKTKTLIIETKTETQTETIETKTETKTPTIETKTKTLIIETKTETQTETIETKNETKTPTIETKTKTLIIETKTETKTKTETIETKTETKTPTVEIKTKTENLPTQFLYTLLSNYKQQNVV